MGRALKNCKMEEGGMYDITDTQDSSVQGNIPAERTNNFMGWLKKTANKNMEKPAIELPPIKAQDGYTYQQTNIPYHLDKNRNIKQGATSAFNADPNAAAYMNAYLSSMPNWRSPIKAIGKGVEQILGAPTVYNLKMPEGQDQINLFEDFVKEGYQNPTLNSFDITSVEKAGKNRKLHYKATGTQKKLPSSNTNGPEKSPVGPLATELPAEESPNLTGMMKARIAYENQFGSNPAIDRMVSPTDQPYNFGDGTTGTHYMTSQDNYAVPLIQNQNDMLNMDENYGPTSNEAIRFDSVQDADYFSKNYKTVSPALKQNTPQQNWIEENKDLMNMLMKIKTPFKWGGEKAQQGKYIPGASTWDPSILDPMFQPDPKPNMSQMSTSHGYMDFLDQINNLTPFQPQVSTTSSLLNPNETSVEETGELLLERENRFKTAMDRNPYLLSSGIIAGMGLLSNIGNIDDTLAQERNIRERVSNVHRMFGTVGEDRGDYMVNTPGIGNALKPNQHTRIGYNTKVAKMGYEVGSELELTDEQIEKLIAQGYEIDYLD